MYVLRRRLSLLAILLLSLLPSGPARAFAPCPGHFAVGQSPRLTNPRLVSGTQALCYQAFAVLHSSLTRTPLYAAERLTARRVRAARDTERDSNFHAEPALPLEQRAELADYARSGWDRGHLAPSGDMPDPDAQQESFSLANIIPQAPDLNRGLWGDMESAVRTLAERRGELYVVTGPVFQGAQVRALNGRVLIPTHVFKAVLDPRRQQAGAYLAPNAGRATWRLVSMEEVRRLTGLDVFPALPARAKQAALRLPNPQPTRPRRR